MKTTLITIALTSLIALNANAATFVMQAKIPSADLQVLEGNKGSEVPVIPEAGQPTTPVANYTKVNSAGVNYLSAQNGYDVAYHNNSTCSYSFDANDFESWNNPSSSYVLISKDEGWSDADVFNNIHIKLGNTLYLADPTLFSEAYAEFGFDMKKFGFRIDENNIIFFEDANANNQFDNGELQLYVGGLELTKDSMTQGDQGNSYHQVCSMN